MGTQKNIKSTSIRHQDASDRFDDLIQKPSFQVILDSIIEAVVILDESLRIHYMNKTAEDITGVKYETIIEQPIDQVVKLYSEDQEALQAWPLQSVIEQGDTLNQVIDYQVKKPDDSIIPITFSASPIRISDGSISGAIMIFRDSSKERELMRLKSEFVSIVSHQLRTPASAVKWYLESTIENRHGNPLNDWQIDKLQQAYQSNERMIQLINDLLNVSRLDSGKFNIKPTSISLLTLFEESIKELTHFSAAHNVEIINNIPQAMPNILVDADKIREVIVNIMSNAIKYSRPGHHAVTVEAKQDGRYVECAVRDEGIGIPEADLVHIFDKFYRADNAVESQTEGSGLGLYIARQIVRAHGGDMHLESIEGDGTAIYFRLPIINNQ